MIPVHKFCSKSKKFVFFVLFFYFVVVLWLTVFKRPLGFYSLHSDLFWSYKRWLCGDWRLGKQILYNIAMFTPFGFLVSTITDGTKHVFRFVVISAILFSGTIEILQFSLMRGTYEFDDLINNTLGAVIGWVLYQVLIIIIPKRHLITTIICVCIIVLVICSVVFLSVRVEDESGNASKFVCFQLEDVILEGNNLTISGIVFGYEQVFPEPVIVLKSKTAVVNMNVAYNVIRQDVNNYFNRCDYNYLNSGFIASAVIDPEVEYEILVDVGMVQSVPADVYLTGTNVHFSPDAKFIPPKVNGTAIAPIVEEGHLRVFRPDHHCWVYQYKEDLYWIVDQDFCFEKDNSTYIQYQLWTTQPENLPKERLENGWDWDNIGGYFEDYEITEKIDCGQYRVMKRKLPASYPITSVLTGYYKNGKWVWQDYFRPIYNFNIKTRKELSAY